MPIIMMLFIAFELASILLKTDMISGLNIPAIYIIAKENNDNPIYIPIPIKIDFTIFILLLLCPITIPNIPDRIMNKNSKNIVIIRTIIRLKGLLFKNMADCSSDNFNEYHVISFKQTIARQITIIINDIESVMIAVKILDK